MILLVAAMAIVASVYMLIRSHKLVADAKATNANSRNTLASADKALAEANLVNEDTRRKKAELQDLLLDIRNSTEALKADIRTVARAD